MVQIQKELISDLMRKNEEIRENRLGQLLRSTGNATPKQGLNGAIRQLLKLQLNKLSVAVLMLSERVCSSCGTFLYRKRL
jgi:hypothetical protein